MLPPLFFFSFHDLLLSVCLFAFKFLPFSSAKSVDVKNQDPFLFPSPFPHIMLRARIAAFINRAGSPCKAKISFFCLWASLLAFCTGNLLLYSVIWYLWTEDLLLDELMWNQIHIGKTSSGVWMMVSKYKHFIPCTINFHGITACFLLKKDVVSNSMFE